MVGALLIFGKTF